MSESLKLVGLAAGAVSTLSWIPQLIELISHPEDSGPSPVFPTISCISSGLWMIYGIANRSIVTVVSSAINIALSVAILIIALTRRRRTKMLASK
jgi:uncharacterized protein with PQ loop repeat